MTPFELEVLMHYYVTPAPHRVELENPPVWAAMRDWFIAEDLLKARTERTRGDGTYLVTERGAAYVEHVLQTPLPLQKWYVPTREGEDGQCS